MTRSPAAHPVARRIHSTLWDDLEDGYSREDAGFSNFSQACVAKAETASAKAYLVERWRKRKGLGDIDG